MRLRMASRCLHLVLVLALLGQGVSSGLLFAYDVAPRTISDAANALSAPEGRDGATAPPEQTRDGTQLEVRLSRETLTADGRDSALLVVLATDARGQPVPDGTRLMLEARGGRLSEQELQTTDGLATARLQAGQIDQIPGLAQDFHGCGPACSRRDSPCSCSHCRAMILAALSTSPLASISNAASREMTCTRISSPSSGSP